MNYLEACSISVSVVYNRYNMIVNNKKMHDPVMYFMIV